MLLHGGVVSIARRGGKSIFHAALDRIWWLLGLTKLREMRLSHEYICTPKFQHVSKWQNYDALSTWQVVEYRATNKPKHFFIIYCQIWWKILAKLLHPMWFISALSWYCRAIMNVWNVIYHFEDGWWPGYKYSSCWYCCCCNRKIYYQPPSTLQWPLKNANIIQYQSSVSNLSSEALAQHRQNFNSAELTFHLLTAHYIFLLHVFPDVRSIWGCSECLLQLRAQSSAETPTHYHTKMLTHTTKR